MKYRVISAVFALILLFTAICGAAYSEEGASADELPVSEETTEGEKKEELPQEPQESEEISTDPPVLQNVNAACVYNIENERYIYEYDADEIVYPASTVKLMTAIVVIEELGKDLTRPITVDGGALVGVEGNRIGLKQGEELTLEQLLYALICGCANDAANVLAMEVAGSVEAFAELMNNKAAELGAVNTHYTNPTGMHHPAMVTTARDTAIISTYAYSLYPICEMASVEKYIIPATNKAKDRTVYNKNHYFSTATQYLYIWDLPRGLNAGYTPEGGYCIATTATKNGLTYVVVCMGASADDRYIYSFTEAADLIKWAFNAYDYIKVLTTSNLICEVDVRLSGHTDTVGLFPSENVELYLPTGIDISKDIKIDVTLNQDYFTAPVSEGAVGGSLSVSYNGVILGRYELVTKNGVSRNNFLYIFDLISDFVVSSAFNMIITFAVVVAAVYLLALVAARLIRRQRRKRRR